jgi:hypothetical protein
MKIVNYFKNEKSAKIIMGVLVFLIILLVAGISSVRAEDNKTIEFTDKGWPKLLDDDKWTSQLVFDTVQACYQGTVRWVVLSHPSLLAQTPTLAAQRQMMEHCFCVMDKIRKENKVEEYKKKVLDPEWGGNTFMLKAMECVNEYKTLPSFFAKIIETPLDNNDKIVIPEDKPKDSQDEPPGQKPKESKNGLPATIFQG